MSKPTNWAKYPAQMRSWRAALFLARKEWTEITAGIYGPGTDVRVGDVWRSKAGRDALVKTLGKHHRIGGNDLVVATLKTGAELICERRNFVKNRTLIERGGVRLGDVRATGEASIFKVLQFGADGAYCEGATLAEWLMFDQINVLPLLYRDGKPVEQS